MTPYTAGAPAAWPNKSREMMPNAVPAVAPMNSDGAKTGYRSIPTIGWMFLLQLLAAFVLAAAVLATAFARGDGLVPRLVAAAGAGFAVATLGGYLLSLWIGLFGFSEYAPRPGPSRA
jgi:hypothetical protein